MSADNYYMIRKDRQGFFVPVMGFASNDGPPHVQANSPRFHELFAAMEFAAQDYTEYGIRVHDECYSDDLPVLSKRLTTGHYANCLAQYSDESQHFECSCETIKKEWEADYRLYAK
jgi:hypothetical protein